MATPAPRSVTALVVAPGLFRVILAYLVVVDHSTGLAVGTTAVYLFFVLSGYWVHEMWFKAYAPLARPYGTFIVSRFWRLLPVYYVCLALRLAVAACSHQPLVVESGSGWQLAHFVLATTTLVGYAQLLPHQIVIYPAWSLDIELQFYAIAPLAVAVMTRYRAFSLPRIALVAVATIGLALFVTTFRMRPQSSYLPMYLVFFLMGLYASKYRFRPRAVAAIASLATTIVALTMLVILVHAGHAPFPAWFTTWLARYNPIASIIPALLGSTYAIATVHAVAAPKAKAPIGDRDLSSMSYEIYLLHVTAIAVLDHFNVREHGRIFGTIVMWIVLFPASFVIYRTFDRPIDRLRTSWVKSRPQRAVSRARPDSNVRPIAPMHGS